MHEPRAVAPPPPASEPDNKTERTSLKLVARSLKPSTGPVPHGCDDKNSIVRDKKMT